MSRFEVPGSLLVLPDDADGVCRLVEEFLLAWELGVPQAWDLAADRLDEAQARLGLPVPPALRWFLLRFSRFHRVVGHQDRLERPENLRVVDEALVFRWENQGCACWGLRVDDLALPDPPVVWRPDGVSGPDGWRPYHDRLSLDLLEWLLGEAVLGSGCGANLELDDGGLAAVRRLPSLPLRAKAFWTSVDVPPSRWRALPDVLVRVDADTWAWAAARTPAALERLVEAVPGDWLMTEDVAG